MDLIRNNNSGKTHIMFRGKVLCRRIKNLNDKIGFHGDRDMEVEYLMRNVPASRLLKSTDCAYCRKALE